MLAARWVRGQQGPGRGGGRSIGEKLNPQCQAEKGWHLWKNSQQALLHPTCLLNSLKEGLDSPQDDPFPFSSCGPVAMNMQTAGLEMDICDGFFHQNGGCGYVLKPDFLRDAQSSFHPEKPISPFKAQTLLIQVQWKGKPLGRDWDSWDKSGKRWLGLTGG